MLLKKLAELADHLDSRGHFDEAMQVDNIIKFITAEAQGACDCPECKKEGKQCDACMDASDGACGCG